MDSSVFSWHRNDSAESSSLQIGAGSTFCMSAGIFMAIMFHDC